VHSSSNFPQQSHRVARILALWLLGSYAYFFAGGGYNQNARLDLVMSVVHRHTLNIDAYHDNTEDKALFDGHHYSDKAPGLALLGVPVAWVGQAVLGGFGYSADDCTGYALLAYGVTLTVAGGAAVAAALAVFYLLLYLGTALPAAIWGAVITGLGTPLWAYATLFWGHALGAALLVTAVLLGCLATDETPARRRWHFVGVGACLGWAVISAYPTALPAAVIGGSVAWTTRRGRGTVALGEMLACTGAAAAACGAILLAHNAWVFGSPFVLGYSHTQGFGGMKVGLFGVGVPRIQVIYEVLIGPTRGLLRLSPVLVLSVAGFWAMWRTSSRSRWVAVQAMGCFLTLLAINAGYTYWNGGYTYGPRHLGDALPLLAVGAGFCFDRLQHRGARLTFAAVALFGIINALMAVSTATPADAVLLPWHEFLSGNLASEPVSVFPAVLHCTPGAAVLTHPAWNLGILMGLPGLYSLLPLLGGWCVALVCLRRACQSGIAPPAGDQR
jgi:hypothetical protein